MTYVYTTSRLLLRTDCTAQGTLLRALWRPKWEGIQKRRDTVGDTEDVGSIPAQKNPLKKEMATHSSFLAWKIPQTEKPGGLQPRGSQSIRHNIANKPPPPSICMAVILLYSGN